MNFRCSFLAPLLRKGECILPIASMYGIFTYIYHKNQPNLMIYLPHRGSPGFFRSPSPPHFVWTTANEGESKSETTFRRESKDYTPLPPRPGNKALRP